MTLCTFHTLVAEEVAGPRDICQTVLTAIFPSGVLQQLFACLTQITTAGHSVLKFRKIVSCGGITNIILVELWENRLGQPADRESIRSGGGVLDNNSTTAEAWKPTQVWLEPQTLDLAMSSRKRSGSLSSDCNPRNCRSYHH